MKMCKNLLPLNLLLKQIQSDILDFRWELMSGTSFCFSAFLGAIG